jgi:molybdenum cofactor biosynthesis enzyme MoaA
MCENVGCLRSRAPRASRMLRPTDRQAIARSSVPDLLFEDVRDGRVAEIQSLLDDPELLTEETALHRLTIFMTYRCNFNCTYCKTIVRSAAELRSAPQKRANYDMRTFEDLLRSLEPGGVRHAHFTGGEATLLRDLPSMVRLARDRGVERISLTSNGSGPASMYSSLVCSGVDEIRISIDACEPHTAELLTNRRGAWEAAVRSIQEIAFIREAGAPVHLIANTVIEDCNRTRIPDIVRFLIGLGVDDVKLIGSVDRREMLADFAEREDAVSRTWDILRSYPDERFPLLRRKLMTVFADDSVGLDNISRSADWRCYVPLTERTVDTAHYYPCSAYLREKGQPIGRIDEGGQVQRDKIAAFVRRGNCLEDPICRRYCLNCTREFNVAANHAREWRLNDIRAKLQAAAGMAALPARPSIIVTPLGMPHREKLVQELEQLDVTITKRTPIREWVRAATLLYAPGPDATDERLGISLAYEGLWRTAGCQDHGERWELSTAESLTTIGFQKEVLRRRLGACQLRPGVWRTNQTANLHSFHVPDPDRWEWEFHVLDSLLAATGSSLEA